MWNRVRSFSPFTLKPTDGPKRFFDLAEIMADETIASADFSSPAHKGVMKLMLVGVGVEPATASLKNHFHLDSWEYTDYDLDGDRQMRVFHDAVVLGPVFSLAFNVVYGHSDHSKVALCPGIVKNAPRLSFSHLLPQPSTLNMISTSLVNGVLPGCVLKCRGALVSQLCCAPLYGSFRGERDFVFATSTGFVEDELETGDEIFDSTVIVKAGSESQWRWEFVTRYRDKHGAVGQRVTACQIKGDESVLWTKSAGAIVSSFASSLRRSPGSGESNLEVDQKVFIAGNVLDQDRHLPWNKRPMADLVCGTGLGLPFNWCSPSEAEIVSSILILFSLDTK